MTFFIGSLWAQVQRSPPGNPSYFYPGCRHSPTDSSCRFRLPGPIGFYRELEAIGDQYAGAVIHLSSEDDSATPTARDGAARRQHHLRNGAARRISAALRPFAPLRRLGPRRGRSLASFAPINSSCPRAVSRRRATSISPDSIVGFGSSSDIEGGMSAGTRFLPATQASMMSDDSCIIWRRCTSYSTSL
jgi:hypothetical protein